jgi:hypothetical protein
VVPGHRRPDPDETNHTTVIPEVTTEVTPTPVTQIRRNYRDAITYTMGVTLIMSQLVLQLLDAFNILSGEPSLTLITAGLGLLGLPSVLHRGDRKEDNNK